MKLPEEAELLRVIVGESDKHCGRPVYEWIVEEARRHGLAGATVLRGVVGYGAHSVIHSAKVLRISQDLPMVVEIIDRPERIVSFLPKLDEIMDDGLVTLQKVHVRVYRHSDRKLKDHPPS